MFFASGVNNFAKLPVLSQNVSEISEFKALDNKPLTLNDKITVLGFFGKDLESHKAYAYNLAHKIYKKNHEFEDFQFVILLPEGAEAQAEKINSKIHEIENTSAWRFAFGSEESIAQVFNSLKTPYILDSNLSSPYVFIIDKENNLRGRNDDDDAKEGKLYGYNSAEIAEINNKMSDDVKVILAEYRLALKKYNTKREI